MTHPDDPRVPLDALCHQYKCNYPFHHEGPHEPVSPEDEALRESVAEKQW